MSLFLVFVFVGLSSAKSWQILAWQLLVLWGCLRGLIGILGLETLPIVGPSLGMIVYLHLVGVTGWIRHGVIGTVGIRRGRRGILGIGWGRNRWWRRRGRFVRGGWTLGWLGCSGRRWLWLVARGLIFHSWHWGRLSIGGWRSWVRSWGYSILIWWECSSCIWIHWVVVVVGICISRIWLLSLLVPRIVLLLLLNGCRIRCHWLELTSLCCGPIGL